MSWRIIINAMGDPPMIDARSLAAALASGEPPLLLDVREPFELEISRLDQAINIPLAELAFEVERLPKQRCIVVVCRSGRRSCMATRYLCYKRFDARNLVGGMNSWAEHVDPSMRRY